MNIPLYRAKKIGSDMWVEGILLPNLKRFNNKSFIINDYTRMQDFDNAVPIDPSTLAIHFPSMTDKNGKKIFASLSEDGVGGDILKPNGIVVYNSKEYKFHCIVEDGLDRDFKNFISLEVIGIHK